jgi:hypothetical protein
MAHSVGEAARAGADRGLEDARHDDEHPEQGEQMTREPDVGTADPGRVMEHVHHAADHDDQEPDP